MDEHNCGVFRRAIRQMLRVLLWHVADVLHWLFNRVLKNVYASMYVLYEYKMNEMRIEPREDHMTQTFFCNIVATTQTFFCDTKVKHETQQITCTFHCKTTTFDKMCTDQTWLHGLQWRRAGISLKLNRIRHACRGGLELNRNVLRVLDTRAGELR